MKKLIILGFCIWAGLASAAEFTTPACYENVPTTCSFDEMTLSLCNKEGKSKKIAFLLSQRMYMPGGNKFGNADGSHVCTVKSIKGTSPKRYTVEIN
ncbi:MULTISPECIES: hypothetical protein [unclassified Marinobacter]|jgi:hypothetical protein|uniref:hypothetical protein n=1 Tax=unclassified Marinobacter TaxID=83889 RepID=UPI00200FC3C1|nr:MULTISPECIES: hypothetical protein [unclassified Marinobacter]MCL1478504.1 hypothetical protein [Marinobacter sp.]UQG55943.1 hypothetical protein MIH16_21550 [Marinobacter sp. M4C]UQG64748.1 hypothetical protein MIH17_21550 [Marinobacter sp. M2C]UQG69026.1 hypothetical protein MIH19_21555 [Marinobacter sp. M1C]